MTTHFLRLRCICKQSVQRKQFFSYITLPHKQPVVYSVKVDNKQTLHIADDDI